MMAESAILTLLRNYNRYKAEMNISCKCLCDDFEKHPNQGKRRQLLEKRIVMINQWFFLLTPKEARVIQLHFLDGLSWNHMTSVLKNTDRLERGCDPRTLQRVQKRAIRKIERFMADSFGETLDYLSANGNDAEGYVMRGLNA